MLEPHSRQDLNRFDSVVFAAQDPFMISDMSPTSHFLVLKSKSCLKLFGIFRPRLSAEARRGPNFVKAALIVRSLNLRAIVAAQEAL